MRELENFGRYLIRELRIDRNLDDDWDYLIKKYKLKIPKSKNYSLGHINFTVAKIYGMGAGELHRKSKKIKYTDPRGVACYMMNLCGHSQEAIAEYYSRKSPGVSAKIRNIELWYKTNRQLREKIDKLREILL